MSKKKYGEGSVFYLNSRKKWCGKICIGTDKNGKFKYKYIYCNTKKECEIKLADLRESLSGCINLTACDITIVDLLKNSNENDLVSNVITAAAYSRRESTLNIIRKSNIGSKPIQQLTSIDIDKFVNSLVPYSDSVIKKVYQTAKRGFGLAVWDDIIKKNPLDTFSGRKMPKSSKEKKKVRALDLDEQRRLLEIYEERLHSKNAKSNYSTQILLALFTGMRMGEVNALNVNDIDFEKREIDINQTVTRGLNYNVELGCSTKTIAGTRKIPMNESVFKLLHYYLDNIYPDVVKGYTGDNSKLLFMHYQNHSIISTEQVNDSLKRCCKKYHIGNNDITSHVMRHTYATRCIESGMPAEVLKGLLGHKDIKITMNTYVDIIDKYRDTHVKKASSYYESNGLGLSFADDSSKLN